MEGIGTWWYCGGGGALDGTPLTFTHLTQMQSSHILGFDLVFLLECSPLVYLHTAADIKTLCVIDPVCFLSHIELDLCISC